MKTIQTIATNMADIKAMNEYHCCIDSIELVADIDKGGLTPSHDLITEACKISKIPIHVMVRHRTDYLFSKEDYEAIIEDIMFIRNTMAASVVTGFLTSEHKIDVERMREVVLNAYPLNVTFHRAFDLIEDKAEALKILSELGVNAVLTSAGVKPIIENVSTFNRLSTMDLPIDIIAGGGINGGNFAGIVKCNDNIHVNSLVRVNNDIALAFDPICFKKYCDELHGE